MSSTVCGKMIVSLNSSAFHIPWQLLTIRKVKLNSHGGTNEVSSPSEPQWKQLWARQWDRRLSMHYDFSHSSWNRLMAEVQNPNEARTKRLDWSAVFSTSEHSLLFFSMQHTPLIFLHLSMETSLPRKTRGYANDPWQKAFDMLKAPDKWY